jgi:hypothetical protein
MGAGAAAVGPSAEAVMVKRRRIAIRDLNAVDILLSS